MAFGGIFAKLKNSKINSTLSYLSLTLTPNRIIASVWRLEEDCVIPFGTASRTFVNRTNLVHETAIAIDKAGENATSDVEKVVFGLSSYYLEGEQPTKETVRLLKNLAQELELDPQAYIPIPAAIAHFFKLEKNHHDFVSVGSFSNFAELALVLDSKLVSIKSLNGTGSEEIAQGVKGFGESSLPGLVALYGDATENKISKVLENKEIFPTKPQVISLSEEEVTKSVTYAQAADVLGREPSVGIAQGERQEEKEILPANEFGFIEGADILKEDVKSEDIAQQAELAPVPAQSEVLPTDAREVAEPAPEKTRMGKFPKLKIPTLNFAFFKNLKGSKAVKFGLGALVAVVVLALVLSSVFAKNITHAQVTLKVNGQEIEKDFNVNAYVTSTPADSLSAAQVATSAQVSQSAVATGTKKVGEAARGQLKVLNWTTQSTNFPKGTPLISKSGIKFKLDSDVQVASRSASTPGQAEVAAIAADLGDTGNISANNDFTFQSYDELLYSAHNDNAFTGGTEKEVTVVAAADIAKLEKSTTDAAVAKAKEDLKTKYADKKIDDSTLVVTITKADFDKKLDDEAPAIHLNLEAQVTAITFSEADLKGLLAKNYASEAPQGFELAAQNMSLSDITTLRQKDKLNIKGHFKASAIPKIDAFALASAIAGKDQKSAKGKIKENTQISEVIFNITPNLPIFSSLPGDPKKIEIKIEAI